MSRDAQAGERTGQGLSGVSAEFVASLGKKVADARASLAALEADLGSKSARDELRRKVHAMGTGARMLHFDVMARALAEAEAALDAAGAGGLSRKTLLDLAKVLDDLPALAWSPADAAESKQPNADEVTKEEAIPEERPSKAELPSSPPLNALVVGPDSLAEMLAEEADRASRHVECERTEDVQSAVEMARALAPDVVILDPRVESAAEFVEALADDPLTEPVPVIVAGEMSSEVSSRFLALGVSRTLTAPFSADALRSICEEVVDQREGRTIRMTLGEPTVEQLGERLAAEVHRALVEAVPAMSRNRRVSLGEGTEIMAAVWGAISRVREVVTARTNGEVRFAGRGPEGTALLAPWLNPDIPGADRARPRGRGAATDVVLEGRRVVVADDDPGVTWFLSDLLRTSGCIVFEALDGQTALDLAMRESPDLVISDILMPKLDGFALSRALKRDVALRDTPVILLSWKEDLLQRVRELGGSAAAYLRKETDARAVLARVREALWPRARVEARLKGTGEIRGRLDGVTPRSLLELVCALRPNARVSVRDASCLYEIEIRDGAPKRASKTSGEGNFTRGEPALASLLGVGAGRFVVAPASSGAIEGELTGTLATLLARPIASARGALSLVPTMLVGRRTRVELDPEMLPGYLSSTPEPARSIVRMIAEGHFVADVLSSGNAMPSLIEDVVSDLASRGAILSVDTEDGEDLLPAAIEDALGILRGAPARAHAPMSALRSSQMPPPRIVRKRMPSEDSLDELLEEATAKKPEPKPDQAPSSLADAVMKEISDRSSDPRRHVSSTPPPLVEPSALKPRSNPPEPDRTENETIVEVHPMTPSVPISTPISTPMSTKDSREDLDAKEEEEEERRPAPKEPQKLARTPMAAEAAKREPPKSDGWKWALGLVAAVVLLGVGVKSSLTPAPPEPTQVAAAPTTDVTYTDLPRGAAVGKNEGWIDVTAPAGVAVLVDGTERGRGPMHATLASGSHAVKCGDRQRTVMVRDGKVARVDLTTP